MILGTAGHIDHGKTALVKALTGVDADRLPEEKRRGITIDLGFAPLVIDNLGTIGVVDVPGHEGFVRTMLAGATGIDLAMLVVAADEGVMPQTREHLEILSLLRIPAGVIALTKCDTVDEEWRRLVADDIRALCANSPLSNAEIVEVSALTGENIPALKAAIARIAAGVSRDNVDDLFRLPVDRVFTVKGTGTVITGTVWTGSVKRDQVVRIEPAGKTARVRAIQSHGHSSVEALPGTRTALALAGVDVDDVERGCTIIADPRWRPTSEIDVALTITDGDFEPTSRTRIRLHLGTADTGARFSRLKRMADAQLSARLILDDAIIARGGDRFVVRTPSPARTVGGGEVIDPFPSRKKKDLKIGPIDERLANMLEAAGPAGLAMDAIPIRLGLNPAESAALLDRADVIHAGPIVVAKETIVELENLLESFTAIHMANHPLEPGVSLQTLRVAAKADPQVIELALDRLEKKNRIERAGSIVRPSGWTSKLDEREQQLSDSILHDICTGVYEPPSISDLELKFGKNTEALLRRLERQGQIERVGEDRYYGREPLDRMVEKLSSTLEPGRNYSPAELKEVLGVTRKYLIPFLEFCDRKGITERLNEGRKLKLQSNER